VPADVDLLTPDDCGEVLTLQRAVEDGATAPRPQRVVAMPPSTGMTEPVT
jgi:hypothetical protein